VTCWEGKLIWSERGETGLIRCKLEMTETSRKLTLLGEPGCFVFSKFLFADFEKRDIAFY
jgi:hypothetical protein